MRILALNWRDIRSPEAGGAEVHLHEILRRLVEAGHDVTLLATRFAAARCLLAERVDGVLVRRSGSWWNAHWTLPRAARRLLRSERFDLLLDDVNKLPFFAPRWSGIPVVAIFLHLLGETVRHETNPFAARWIQSLERRIGTAYRGTPAITISRSTAEELASEGLDGKDLRIIPPGLDHSIYRPPDVPSARDPQTPHLLVVSRLKFYKRVDLAIQALARVRRSIPGARLTVLGDGSARPSLERLASRLNQPVRFLGSVSTAEKCRELQQADLTLLTSEKEGFGLVALESFASGTPVIATDVPGHRDSVPEGAGLLVPAGDPQAMGEAILGLLRDPGRRSSFRDRGLRIASRFSWDATATSVESVLRATLETRREAPIPSYLAVESAP